MTSLPPIGTRMVRVSDGTIGKVIQEPDGNARIHYQDRGDWHRAAKAEQWVPADPPSWPLREEEKRSVAQMADCKLRAIVNHEPDKFWWEGAPAEPFDQGLVACIMEYLSR